VGFVGGFGEDREGIGLEKGKMVGKVREGLGREFGKGI
jgi:hypothetical protein